MADGGSREASAPAPALCRALRCSPAGPGGARRGPADRNHDTGTGTGTGTGSWPRAMVTP